MDLLYLVVNTVLFITLIVGIYCDLKFRSKMYSGVGRPEDAHHGVLIVE